MASASDIAQIRLNVAEPTNDPYTDETLSDRIDADGVALASAHIWREKAARYAELVDVTIAGDSERLSELSKSALAMAKSFDVVAAGILAVETDAPRVRPIERP